MMKFHSEIINKSAFIAALMDEDKLVYVLYSYRGHVYRYENGKITAADDADRKQAERSERA